MAEIKDVVDQLIDQTNSGKIEWEKETFFWAAQCGQGRFTILHENTDLIYQAADDYSSVIIGQGDAVQPLIDLLRKRYPPKSLTQDEALQNALQCLTDEGME